MPKIMIDAHVHLHPGTPAIGALLAARQRMAAMAAGDCLPVVLLAEQQGCRAFEDLRALARPTQEAESLWLDGADGPLLVIAGRQVVSAERLEILAQATVVEFADGTPAERLLEAMIAAGAIITLPWGAGKWLGRRGALLDRLLAADGEGALLLGDNGGRPAWWRERRLAGRPVLRGSDPLPIAGDASRIGSFGSVLEGTLSRERPAAGLRAIVRALRNGPAGFGRQASPFRFVSDQIRMRITP